MSQLNATVDDGMPAASATERCLARSQWQPVLFAEQPRRTDLLRLQANWPLRPVRIRVHRNRPFEHLEAVLEKFLAYADLQATIIHSEYDDSLNIAADVSADLEIVWLDYARYRIADDPDGFIDWLVERIGDIRRIGNAPILLADWDRPTGRFNERLKAATGRLPGVHLCPLSEIAGQLGNRYASQRLVGLTGSDLTDAAWVEIARHFGLKWIPATLAPPVKAIAVDLDQTLYQGVLGEDGVAGITVNSGHLALQRKLADLSEQGVFIAILSRNEEADVSALFEARTDFVIKRNAFSAAAISWGSKAAGLRQIAGQLNIGTDAVLVIDDNAGELAAMAGEIPHFQSLHAGPDAMETARAIDFYPGLMRWHQNATDSLRRGDIEAAADRLTLQEQASSPDDYLKSLQIGLRYALDPEAHGRRLHQLSIKTNQFNLALARFSEAEVASYFERPDRAAVAIWLADRLSDSGLIGAVFATRQEERLVIDEICLSCRALGRRLEDVMLGDAIAGILKRLPADRLVFRYAQGARNAPAREWLAAATGGAPKAGEGAVELDTAVFMQQMAQPQRELVKREWPDEP
jgi:FkbH-like protein